MPKSSWFRKGFVAVSAIAGVFVSGFYASKNTEAVRVQSPRIPPVKNLNGPMRREKSWKALNPEDASGTSLPPWRIILTWLGIGWCSEDIS